MEFFVQIINALFPRVSIKLGCGYLAWKWRDKSKKNWVRALSHWVTLAKLPQLSEPPSPSLSRLR